ANGKIAFLQRGTPMSYDGCTYAVNPDGTGRGQLTFCGYGESKPAWSADGNRLAFEGFYTIEFWDVTGYTQVVYNDGRGTLGLGWSPDGQRIVATNGNCGSGSNCSQLYTVR